MRAALLVLLAGCNQLLGTPDVERGPCAPEVAFGAPAPVAGLDDGLDLHSAQLSRDELTVTFSRLTVVGPDEAPRSRLDDLYVAHRAHLGDAFSAAAPLDELNSELDEIGASVSDDQRTVYFARRDVFLRYQILSAHRPTAADLFGAAAPVALGDDLRSNVEPFATPDALYFASQERDGSSSLFAADGRDAQFAAPHRLASLETLAVPAYSHPVVSSDGRTIYFSAPPDNASPQDIWRASRASLDQPFDPPQPVPELATVSAERPAWLSPDACRLYFTTNRAGRGFELWVASRAR